MVRRFLVIRKRNSKRYMGAVPLRKGASVKRIKLGFAKAMKKGFSIKIISSKQLKSIILRQSPKKRRG